MTRRAAALLLVALVVLIAPESRAHRVDRWQRRRGR